MKKLLFFLAFVSAVHFQNSAWAADLKLTDQTTVHFASANEARKILTTKDEFITRLGPFDRAARMKTDKPVSEEEFLNFVGNSVLDWTNEEVETLRVPLETIHSKLRGLSLSLPATIQLIKTTGAEEGNAAYTQDTAIVLPKGELSKSQNHLTKLLSHELFHVVTRQNPKLRKQLYGIIGFTECDEVELPPALVARKITNPDAPRNNYFIRLKSEEKSFLAIPVLISTTDSYDVARGGEFFDYLSFQFLVVEKSPDSRRVKVVYENSKPKLIDPKSVSGFFEQIGKNTVYIIHPEEILADNFALLILGGEKVPSPEIPQKMKKILFRG